MIDQRQPYNRLFHVRHPNRRSTDNDSIARQAAVKSLDRFNGFLRPFLMAASVFAVLLFAVKPLLQTGYVEFYTWLHPPFKSFEVRNSILMTSDDGPVLVFWPELVKESPPLGDQPTCSYLTVLWDLIDADGWLHERPVDTGDGGRSNTKPSGQYRMPPWKVYKVPPDTVAHSGRIFHQCVGLTDPTISRVGPWPVKPLEILPK